MDILHFTLHVVELTRSSVVMASPGNEFESHCLVRARLREASPAQATPRLLSTVSIAGFTFFAFSTLLSL